MDKKFFCKAIGALAISFGLTAQPLVAGATPILQVTILSTAQPLLPPEKPALI